MLIATDLDGTLVSNDTVTLPPFTAGVLRRLDTVQLVAQHGAPSCADEGVAQVLERILKTTIPLTGE